LLVEADVHNILSRHLSLNIEERKANFVEYNGLLKHVRTIKEQSGPYFNIGIIGKYTGMKDTYLSLIRALEMAAFEAKGLARIKWISSEDEDEDIESALKDVDHVVIPGGFGVRGIEGMINSVRICKKMDIPVLGICLGCQILLIEHARNDCGLIDANSKEFDKDTPYPVVIDCADTDTLGGTMRLGQMGVQLYDNLVNIYGTHKIYPRFRHRYVINKELTSKLLENNKHVEMLFLGFTEDNLISIISQGKNIGVQYHPELRSRPDPIFIHFLKTK
jgi:CTP synthase